MFLLLIRDPIIACARSVAKRAPPVFPRGQRRAVYPCGQRRERHGQPDQRILPIRRLLRPSGWRVFPILLPAVRRRVEEAVGVGEPFRAAGVGRVGVEHLVVDAEEDAQTMQLKGLPVRG